MASQEAIKYGKLGDLFNVISLTNVFVYAYAVIRYARLDDNNESSKDSNHFFDDEWLKEGFCVVNKDVPYWNSHDMCFYLDVILVALSLVAYGCLKDKPGLRSANEIVWWNLLGHLGHGLAHGAIGAKYRNESVLDEKEDLSTVQEQLLLHQWSSLLFSVAFGITFWFGLLKGVMTAVPNHFVLAMAAISMIGQLFIRKQLGFMYIQTILGFAFTVTQTQRPRHEKDFAYASFAFMGIVLSVIPWIEATACQSFASRFGGHLMYDAAIPTLLMSAYFLCYLRGRGNMLNRKEV